MKKLMMLGALMALALVVAAPAALAQDVKAEALPGGKASAQAGEEVKTKADPECAEAVAGGVASKACPGEKPPPPPPPKAAPPPPAPAPPPKAAPPPPAPKPLPPSGGAGVASLLALGAGALLVGGGLLVRRIVG